MLVTLLYVFQEFVGPKQAWSLQLVMFMQTDIGPEHGMLVFPEGFLLSLH